VEVTQGTAGTDDAHNREATQLNALELAFGDLPAKDSKVADVVDFRVGETWPSVDVRCASFDVFAAELGLVRESGRQ
jgi:hypothetical protein